MQNMLRRPYRAAPSWRIIGAIGSRARTLGKTAAVCSVALATALSTVTPASANHSWGNYHWARTSNPFTIKIGDNVNSTWDPFLGTASADWTLSNVVVATVVTGQANPKNCRPTAGQVEVCNSTYGNNGWLGIAQIWASGNHITQGVVKLNDTYFNIAKYNTPAWRSMVVCQEVGHTFGLDHQDENFSNTNLGTCMDYTNDPSGTAGTNVTPNNEHPNQHDYDELATIYAHADGSTTIAQAPASSASRGVDNGGTSPADWGQAVAFSSDGRGRVYVRDLGAGQRLITFVNLVPGGRPGAP